MLPAHPPLLEPDARLRVLLCGYGHLGLALLQGLLENTDLCEVVGVFRWSSRPDSQNFWEPAEGVMQQTVQATGLRDIVCPGMNSFEFTSLLQTLKPHVVLVGSWGEILKAHLIEQPDFLLINCHPSKLPAHRGANPYSSVIRAAEAETGVTFHRMAKTIDSGAIILQQSFPIVENESGLSVRDKCTVLAYQMVRELLARLHATFIGRQPLAETEQDHSLQSYYPPLKTEDGLINWNESVDALARQYRALFPWIICHSYLEGKRVVAFYDSCFIPRTSVPGPELPVGQPPGTILAFRKGVVTIALSDPDWVMCVSMLQIAFRKGYLPVPVSRMFGGWWLRSGRRFTLPL